VLLLSTSCSNSTLASTFASLTTDQVSLATPTSAATPGIPDLGPTLIAQEATVAPPPAPTTASVAPTPATETVTEAVVSVDALNLRAGPGATFNVVGGLQRNDVLRVNETSPDNAWLKVRSANNVEGWVMSRFVTQRSSQIAAAPQPVPQNPPTAQPTIAPTAGAARGLWAHVRAGQDITATQKVTVNLQSVAPYRIIERRNLSSDKRVRQGLWIIIPDSSNATQVATTLAVVAISHAETPRTAGPKVVVVYAYKSEDEIAQGQAPSVGWAQYAVDGLGWNGSQKTENGVQIQLSDGSNLLAIAPAP